jgi:large subunit ribosomal protein L25
MPEVQLHVAAREKTGHQGAKTLRNAGRVPAVFYARNENNIPLSLDAREFTAALHREANIMDVIFPDGTVRKSIIRGIQRDPVTDSLVHVDLMGISMTEKVRLAIPVVLKGSPLGVKNGGVLEQLLRMVEVEGLPLDLPEHIEFTVDHLDIGDTISLETAVAGKFRFVTDVHLVVANVVQPKVVKADTVAEAAVAAEGAEGAEAKPEGAEGAKEGKESKDSKDSKDAKDTKDAKGKDAPAPKAKESKK